MFARLNFLPTIKMNDWGEVYFHQAAARESVLSGTGIPYWCPYVNGGYPLASHPYDPSLSPLFPVTLVFGEMVGIRLILFLCFATGLLGMWALARRVFRFSYLGSFVSTAVLAVSGWLPMRFFGGNFTECLLYMFPAMMYCVHRGSTNRVFQFLGGLILYIMLAQGKFTYPVSIFYLFLWWSIEKILSLKSNAKSMTITLQTIIISVIISCIFGITKIYLMSGLLQHGLMPIDYRIYDKGLSIYESFSYFYLFFIKIYNFTHNAVINNGQMNILFNNGPVTISNSYIGCGGIVFLLCVIWLIKNLKRNTSLFIIFTITIIISATNYFPIDIFLLLSKIPIFHSIKSPAKYFNYFLLFVICIGNGGFFNAINMHPRLNIKNFIVVFMLIMMIFPAIKNNASIIPLAFTESAPKQWARSEKFFNVDYGDLYPNLKQRYGIVKRWCGNIVLPTAVSPAFICTKLEKQPGDMVGCDGPYAPNPSYAGEVRLKNGNGLVSFFSIDFNVITLGVSLFAPDTVIVNQNPAPGWKSDRGKITRQDGLMAVEFDKPFTGYIHFIYRPSHIRSLLALNIVAVFLLLLWTFHPLLRKKSFERPSALSAIS